MSLFIYINMSLRNQIEVLSERHSDACLKVIILFVLIDVAKVQHCKSVLSVMGIYRYTVSRR